MLGHPPWSARERTERFEEFVELTDLLLRQPAVSYTGRHYAADEARTHPGCVQSPRIPFAIAATGRRGLRLAAVHAQCWITNGARDGHEGVPAHRGAEIVSEQTSRLEEACAAAGRDPASLARMVVTGTELDAGLASVEAFRDTAGRYAEAGVTDLVVHWPRPEPPFAADLATFERIFSERGQA
jgi:alkanesulfonate monooxygenase SsuD/methylene tetrahydromethanopterin reductase-like flavin-dependent oxidoreductase (luciferase family)